MSVSRSILCATSGLLLACSSASLADDAPPSAERGLELLTSKPYLSGDFDRSVFDALWAVWPEPARSQAKAASAAERRKLILARYGLHEAPGFGGDLSEPPAGYVENDAGKWAINCFVCHAGSVAGLPTTFGLGNSHFAMHTLIRDQFAVKLRQFKRPVGLELASQFFPLNSTDGKTNAVVFGIAVGASRDPDLNIIPSRIDDFVHHDMDAPPWWHAKKKSTLYCDGYAPKTHRVIMPFVMSSANDGPTVRAWEDDFRHILAYIESIEAPKYPFKIDHAKAQRGKSLFSQNCTECHGSYGDDESFPEKVVDINIVQTDPVRLRALTPEHRSWTKSGWLGRYGEDPVDTDPIGYLAPPLDGIWASAPYLHNGSVPTLWHLMHPSERPNTWRRTRDGFDTVRVGLEFVDDAKIIDELPESVRRQYYDASRVGMSNEGHRFFDHLDEAEKADLLEYLKTL